MSNIPKIVFIVPYRNRPQHKFFFSNYLTTIMNESQIKDDYYLIDVANGHMDSILEITKKLKKLIQLTLSPNPL